MSMNRLFAQSHCSPHSIVDIICKWINHKTGIIANSAWAKAQTGNLYLAQMTLEFFIQVIENRASKKEERWNNPVGKALTDHQALCEKIGSPVVLPPDFDKLLDDLMNLFFILDMDLARDKGKFDAIVAEFKERV